MNEAKTHLAKLIMVLVQEIGALHPMAFKDIHLDKAIDEANSIALIKDTRNDDE